MKCLRCEKDLVIGQIVTNVFYGVGYFVCIVLCLIVLPLVVLFGLPYFFLYAILYASGIGNGAYLALIAPSCSIVLYIVLLCVVIGVILLWFSTLNDDSATKKTVQTWMIQFRFFYCSFHCMNSHILSERIHLERFKRGTGDEKLRQIFDYEIEYPPDSPQYILNKKKNPPDSPQYTPNKKNSQGEIITIALPPLPRDTELKDCVVETSDPAKNVEQKTVNILDFDVGDNPVETENEIEFKKIPGENDTDDSSSNDVPEFKETVRDDEEIQIIEISEELPTSNNLVEKQPVLHEEMIPNNKEEKLDYIRAGEVQDPPSPIVAQNMLKSSTFSREQRLALCSMCLMNKSTMKYLPCGHSLQCGRCPYPTLEKSICPLCRSVIDSVVSIRNSDIRNRELGEGDSL